MAVALPSASNSPKNAPNFAPNHAPHFALATDLTAHCPFTRWMFINTLLLESKQ
jgi:hypothetical protein